MTMRRYLLVWAVLAAFSLPVYAQPPSSATVTGVTNVEWPAGLSDVAAFGQLVEQRVLSAESTDVNINTTDVTLTPSLDSTEAAVNSTDVIVRSGVATQAGFVRVETTGAGLSLEPFRKVSDPIVQASRLCGAGYQFGIGTPAKIPLSLAVNADRSVVFASEAEAVDKLKTLISLGIPVMVDVDFFPLFDEVLPQEPGLAARTKAHESRFVVVTGYDPTHYFFTDNGPVSDLGSSGEDISVSDTAFLDAWRGARSVRTGRLAVGPFFMLIVSGKPSLTSPAFTLAYEGEYSAKAPGRLRLASRIIDTTERNRDTLIRDAGVFADTRSAMADFAAEGGHTGIEDNYRASSNLWRTLAESTDAGGESSTLDSIASEEDAALTGMRDFAPAVPAIQLLGPPDGAHVDLTNVTFRWSALPEVGRTVLQIATTNDFSARSKVVTFVPRDAKTAFTLTRGSLARIFLRNFSATSLAWRVRAVGVGASIVSQERTLTFTPPAITIVSPPTGTEVSETNLPTFVFAMPTITTRPRVLISTTNSFEHRRNLIILTPRNGETSVTMRLRTFKAIQRREKKDTDNGTVFFMVEDRDDNRTGVRPSEVRTFTVPVLP